MGRLRSLRQPASIGLAVAFVGLAVVHGVRATSRLDWPHDPDHLRDIAHAQNIAEGRLLEDPYFADEWAWYNPLVPAVTAAVATISGKPVPVVHSRFYAYLNAAAPLAFYLLLAVIAGPQAAVVGLAFYLFVVEDQTWLWGTYSPHPFAANLAQAPFFLTLAAWWITGRRPTPWRYLATGALLGLTALAHTAPAALAAGVIAVDAASETWRRRSSASRPDVRQLLGGVIIMGAAAAIVALPLLIPIAGHYGLRIRNPVPLVWLDPRMDPGRWRTFALELLAQWWINLPTLAGLAWLAAGGGSRRARIVLGTIWLLSGVLFFYTAWAVEWFRDRGVALPYLIPAHHFLLYWRVGQAMLAGVGLSWLLSVLLKWWIRPREKRQAAAFRGAELAATLGIAVVVAVLRYPSFAERDDFHYHANVALTKFTFTQIYLYDWVRTRPEHSVFLTSTRVGESIIGPAGRKVVAVQPFFSNPYLSHARLDALGRMWDALAAADCAQFDRLASEYRVTYVVTQADDPIRVEPGTCGLVVRLRTGDVVAFQRPGA
jgi:hypothetical protein